jgi:hypothetical protein
VEAAWTLEADGVDPPPPTDPLLLLDLPRAEGGASASTLTFCRAPHRCAFQVDAPPLRSSALRLCPTPLDAAIEVVMLPTEEALLLRPDVLLASPGEGALDA